MDTENINNQTESRQTLEDVFAIFYGSDPMRLVMNRPFVIGEYTYATDGYTAIRCKNERIDFEYKNDEIPPRVESVVPATNTSEVLDFDSVDWQSLMTVPEKVEVGDNVDCGHCDGTGSCSDVIFYKGNRYDYDYECPVCDGSGWEEEAEERETGNMEFSSTDKIRLRDSFFYANKFYRLKKVKDLVGENVELISYTGPDKGAMFKIGFLEILLMPCVSDSDVVLTFK